MSNVIKFPRVTHRCKSAKEAESYFPLLTEGKAKCIHVVRNGAREWLVKVEYWKAEKIDTMAQAVANARKEWVL